MDPRFAVSLTLLASIAATGASAQDDDLAQGEKLYVSQCKICHGSASTATGEHAAIPSQPRIRLAMYEADGSTAADFPFRLFSGFGAASATESPPETAMSERERIAFAPPFGPNLHGVVGRQAGTVKGFNYSSAFVKALKGMEWTEAALNVWITNPQAWVPGVYMFYKQPNADVRRKIILYLKANS